MLQFQLQIHDENKAQFVLDILRLMSFVEVKAFEENQSFDADLFLQDIHTECERNKKVLDSKIDELFLL